MSSDMTGPADGIGPAARRLRLAPLLVAAGAILVVASRKPDQWITPQFWAEDGRVFFVQAVEGGGSEIFRSYAGYLHLVPRLIAWLCRPLPWEYWPPVFMLAAAAILGWVAARIWCARLPVRIRLAGVVALVGVPHSGEVFLNVTNLQWALGVVLAVNLLEPLPDSRAAAWRRGVEGLVAGLSGPIVLLLLPWAALRAWHGRRNWCAHAMLAGWWGAALVQAAVLAVSDRGAGAVAAALATAPGMMPRYAAAMFLGEWVPYSATVGGVMLALVAAMALLAWRGANPTGRLVALLTVLAALGLLIAGGVAGSWGDPFGVGARYTYVPLILLAVALAQLVETGGRRSGRIAAWGLLAAMLGSAASRWTAVPSLDLGWAAQVREVRAGKRSDLIVPPGWVFPVPGSKRPGESR